MAQEPRHDKQEELENEAARHAKRALEAVSAADREAADRSWIARWIIWIFVIVVVVGLAILVAEGYATGRWDLASEQATDLIKSTVLPVVTLVLGYYFGRSDKG